MGQQLETTIVINARTGNGFSQVGATLTELGSLVNGTSQQLIEFGKDSTKVYREYEKSMADAEVALSTRYGRSTRELASVMNQLNVSATEWAATTIFHTNDVANAISEAAHAGWDYDQIMSGIPAAMQLAQAGSLDLSEAVNYIVKSTNAAGIGFEDLGGFIDLWTYAANSSASTIGEFGDAMLRMGSTMRFTGSTEELMTLMAVTANAGSVGSEAGTMIRNSILRLIAPTEKAEKVMAQLGATSLEAADVMNDEALAAANAELAAHGFSAFYQDGQNKGQLKDVLDIYRELYVALGEIAGGYDNIDRNEAAISALSAIFPTRTVTEALTLLRGAAEDYNGLYESMMGGDAAGYGEYAATTMMNTLDGRIETYESKVERLKQVTGNVLSGDVEGALNFFGGVADSIASMDEAKFSALVSGLEVIAVAGPGLLTAGGALRLIGHLITPTGMIGMGAIALVAAAAAINDFNESANKANFGNLELDKTAIAGYINEIGAAFAASQADITAYNTAVETAISDYTDASSTFKESLLTKMLTGATLTDQDIATLNGLGDQMRAALLAGIDGSYSAAEETLAQYAGDLATNVATDNTVWSGVMDTLNYGYESAIIQAESLSQQLREAMTSAFEDGSLTSEEIDNIQSIINQQNELLAMQADAQNATERQKLLRQAQTLGLDGLQEISQMAEQQRQAELATLEDNFWKLYYQTQLGGQMKIRDGVRKADGSLYTQADLDAELAYLYNGDPDNPYDGYLGQRNAAEASFDQYLLDLWDSTVQGSELRSMWDDASELASMYFAGQISGDNAHAILKDLYGNNRYAGEADSILNGDNISTQLGEYLAREVAALGGHDGIGERIGYYEAIGDTVSAERLRNLYAMEQIVNNFAQTGVTSGTPWNLFDGKVYSSAGDDYAPRQANRGAFEELMSEYTQDYSLDAARETIDYLGNGTQSIAGYMQAIGDIVNGSSDAYLSDVAGYKFSKIAQDELNRIYEQMAGMYDLDAVAASMGQQYAESSFSDYFAIWDLLYGQASARADDYRIPLAVEPMLDEESLLGLGAIPVSIQPKIDGEDSMSALQEQGVTVDVGADSTELQATIDGADGQKLIEYLDGDATNLALKITDQDGRVLTEIVNGNTAQLAAAIGEYQGKTVTVNVTGKKLFATGGRATSASIFGEAGPEWAIPEQHSDRTAELLNAAREASGFTWPDLLSRFGGLNANVDRQPTTIIYSPTINAADATGVEQVLQEDKKRLEKWFEEKKLRDAVEVYS